MYFWACEYDGDAESCSFGAHRSRAGVAESVEKAKEYIEKASRYFDVNDKQYNHSFYACIKEISADCKRVRTVVYYDNCGDPNCISDSVWYHIEEDEGSLWEEDIEL